jgi:hypothetical protein
MNLKMKSRYQVFRRGSLPDVALRISNFTTPALSVFRLEERPPSLTAAFAMTDDYQRCPA